MPRYQSVRTRRRLSPYHRKNREEARRKRESQKQCNSPVQNGKGSTTSGTAGQPIEKKSGRGGFVNTKRVQTFLVDGGQPNDNILERISLNCANCASQFEYESDRNVKFQTVLAHTNEIEIIDAIFYIYRLTVADWSKTLTLDDHESDFTSASEIVFSNGIPFCSKCTSALKSVYTSHKNLKELGHSESLFAKAINKKYSCEVENHIECDGVNEASSLNHLDLSEEELEFKEEDDSADTFLFDLEDATLEVNSELNQLNYPLMVHGAVDLQFSNNIEFDVSYETSENTIVTGNDNMVSLTDDQPRRSSRFIPKILQRHRNRNPLNPKRPTKNSNFSLVSKPKKELNQLNDPLMMDGVDDQHFSNNIAFDVSEETSENTIDNIVSLTDDQRKTNTIKPKFLQHHRHPLNIKRSAKNSRLSKISKPHDELSWPEHEISDLNKKIFLSGVPQKRRYSVPTRKTLQLPKPIPDHSFNISCCDESFLSREGFINHQLDSHKDEMPKLVKCNICEILIPKINIANHMKTYNEIRKQYFKCKICASQFITASGMTEHLETHDPVKYSGLICDICGTPTQSDFQLVVHKVKVHSELEMHESEQVYTCNICNSKIKTLEGFKLHCDKHNPENQVTCKMCDKLFPSPLNLKRHMKRMHLDILAYKYSCSKCNMMFRTEQFLTAHHAKSMACHFPKSRSVCEKCGKSVLFRHMKRHMRDHEDVECPNKELFRCPQCGKMLKHRDSLQKHRRREHPAKEKLFFCEKCGKTTKNMTNMRIHMKVHEKD